MYCYFTSNGDIQEVKLFFRNLSTANCERQIVIHSFVKNKLKYEVVCLQHAILRMFLLAYTMLEFFHLEGMYVFP